MKFHTADEYYSYNEMVIKEYALMKLGFYELCQILQLDVWVNIA
jgi:hypothetical protein